jgi:hypothetical protein
MMGSSMNIKRLFGIALFVRLFSQFQWEFERTINLSIEDFFYGLIIAPHVWVVFEIAKIFTSVLVAMVALKLAALSQRHFHVSPNWKLIGFVILIVCLGYLHGLAWLIYDCQSWGEQETRLSECFTKYGLHL